MQEKREDRTIESEIKELVRKREELYRKIKEKLTPLILEITKDAEKVKGYKDSGKLCDELSDTFGLMSKDYERIIIELSQEGLIKKRWSPGIGGYMTTKTNT